jgi:glycosyltransferase involved in cell wall biosynthesis
MELKNISKISSPNMVLHVITGLGNGGAEGVLYRLVTGKSTKKHVVVSMTDMGKYGPMLQSNFIDVYNLNMPRGRVTLSGIFRFYKILMNLKPNVVQTWMYHSDLFGGVMCYLLGIRKIFWNVRGAELNEQHTKLLTRATVKFCALFSRIIPASICTCSFNAITVHKKLGYVDNFTYIPNGIDTVIYCPNVVYREEFRSELNIEKDDFLIGMVARYAPQKDHKILLESLSKIIKKFKAVNIKCVLIGKDLNYKNPQIVKQINSLGLMKNVLLYGESDNIPKAMNGLDLHVLSSAYGEGFPNVIVEAMACGVPCVATNVGDSALIINDNKSIVEPGDFMQLSNSITRLVNISNDKDKWMKLCNESRRRVVTNYSLEVMVGRYHRMWNSK